MAEAGTASIWRASTGGTNTEAQAKTAGDIIEFNGTGLSPDDNGSITSLTLHFVEDLSIQPNPNRHLSQIQDGKLGTMELIIKGTFQNQLSAGGIAKFFTWMKSDKTDATFIYGRFGIRYNKMTQVEVIPTALQGYILFDFIIDDIDEFENIATFTARFYKNGVA